MPKHGLATFPQVFRQNVMHFMVPSTTPASGQILQRDMVAELPPALPLPTSPAQNGAKGQPE